MPKSIFTATVVILLCCSPSALHAQRTFRLNAVDLKERILWDAECLQPDGQGLAFGGQDQDADDGRPHTRIRKNGQWHAIHQELRKSNPLQSQHAKVWQQRQKLKNTLARARHIYFRGLPDEEEIKLLNRDVNPALQNLEKALLQLEVMLPEKQTDEYLVGQIRFAGKHIRNARTGLPSCKTGVTPEALRKLLQAQILLELAAEALDAEPPARAMNCGTARLPNRKSGPESNTLVYDPGTKLYILFGGDHLDYLTNDTWVFDPQKRRWFQRHPKAAPPPRANHRLEVVGDGSIRLTGGYTYSSATGYLSGQYVALDDGTYTYDIQSNVWKGKKLTAPDSRVYRSGPFHPNYYLQGPKPNAAKFADWLKTIPVNEWVPTNPPHLPRLNRDWGTARIDPDRDMMLRWSGGHSAHGGTDVPHFHFATNRWELPFPVEFPLGQLYSNTSYPRGFNFNLRPWMTGHTYQHYDYDLPSKTMINAGRPRHFYIYDPDVGDWTGRGMKPKEMQYNSAFYTMTLTSTPHGVVCWDRNGRVHRYNHKTGKWKQLKLTGDKLPGARVDNSSIVYDSKRDRVLIVNSDYGKTYDGFVWSVDLQTKAVKKLSPKGSKHAVRFANIDKTCYDGANDLMLFGTYLKDSGGQTPTPAFDCAKNQWITLDLRYKLGKRFGNTTRAFPHRRSDALMYDAKRQLIWGTDTNSQVYVLRLDLQQAKVQSWE